ncbi:mannose-1-phosphate guanylyltransferase [Desulfacinum hydrothermale DSM 13146]|uniref:Mannose-1-phosphate guanylyltransferase n=1 Tax=Desulfacinum hydrothermale DSM 13146 TaxID=1121390 RepID=A0A1W1XJ78_9BACT|nr:sugar phosphate nucleotidyltransferase [Desulfacinum hydrothermale]SMC24015.1 mannose-1-phosphate guanylyltransferase [Desulfacinum hydrothermale DSM 13146]
MARARFLPAKETLGGAHGKEIRSVKAMILAAGFGHRLRPLTLVRPKPLCPVGNVPLVDDWIRRLARAGISEIVINAHHLADRLEAHLRSTQWPVPVHLLREEKILGTGGGLRNALPLLGDDPFLVVNGDIACDLPIGELMRRYRNSGAPALLVLCRTGTFDSVLVNQSGDRIQAFTQGRSEEGKNGKTFRPLWTFTGVHVIDPHLLKALPAGKPFHIIPVYERLIQAKNPPAAWCLPNLWWREIGSVEAYWALNRECMQRTAGPLIPDGTVRGRVLIHPTARVDHPVYFEDTVVIGPRCHVGREAHLRDVILWEDVRVAPGVSLKGCIVTDGIHVPKDQSQAILLPDGKAPLVL